MTKLNYLIDITACSAVPCKALRTLTTPSSRPTLLARYPGEARVRVATPGHPAAPLSSSISGHASWTRTTLETQVCVSENFESEKILWRMMFYLLALITAISAV
jgi:hypothetical protein